MEFSKCAAVLYSRIQRLEPENATRIIGYLLMNLQCEKELTKLAFGPDTLIISLIDSAKVNLRILSTLDQSLLSPRINEADSCSHELPGNYFYGEPYSIYHITDRRPTSVQQPHVKICHYFSKGFCKNGNNCRYLHGNLSQETWPYGFVSGSTELVTDDQVCSPGSMDRLERELIELLKPRGGIPISIASLPMLYYEKYGRSLEVEGYLNGSHRQGDSGCNLTRLVSRLNNTIRLIDRHHGHHSIVLEEDLHKYSENVYERSGHGVIVTGSRQIYLTFPAESPFSEEDVSNYFRKFGQVEDVRIPNQQKRMFGFVTFVSPETVRQILEKGNPHFVCGSRVLVKPYREKPCRHNERKYAEKCLGPASQFLGIDAGSLSALRSGEGPGLCGRDDREWELEIELRRLSNLRLMNSQQQLINNYNTGRREAESGVIDTTEEGSYTQQFEYLLDILSQESSSNDEITGHTITLDQTERIHHP